MGKLTIDIPEGTHHHIKVIAANRGVTMKDYILDKLMAELEASTKYEVPLAELATAWEERRKDLKLGRGERNLRDIIHDGHQW